MKHNLTNIQLPAFRDERADSQISEICLRILVERKNWQFEVVGTAVLIAGHLAITAKHVLEHIIETYGAKEKNHDNYEINNYEVKLYQILPGPNYRIWNVVTAWPCSTDIAILHLGLTGVAGTISLDEKVDWRVPTMRVLPPPVGQKVIAFGYRESKITVTESEDGVHHIQLNDSPTTSIGTVRQVHPSRRDISMLPFPCFEVEARFDHGMSGGLVVDEEGALCGLICSGFNNSDRDASPISYVVTLWPMLKTIISANRGNKYPKDVSYPIIDLALDGLIHVKDLQELEPAEFPDKQLKRR